MKEYIYLIHTKEFIDNNENIYKIGKTKQDCLKRIKSYRNGSILLFIRICDNCDLIEKELIKLFKDKFIFKKEYGKEYFQGDYLKMIKYINEFIMNRVNKININIKFNNIIKEKINKNKINEENLNNTIVKYSNNDDDNNDDNDDDNDDDIIAPYSNYILNNIYIDNGINELKVIQCNNCSCKYCFPIEFDKELKYYDFRLPFKNNSINYNCNSCFQDFLKKDVKIKCICGVKYQRNGTKFINNHYSNNTIHLLFKKDKELFYKLYDKFNKNIYNSNTNELKTIIDNYNIEIKYYKKITNLYLLELLLNYFKNIDLSTIQINKNIYSVNINMSIKELYKIIHENDLNIRNIHSIKKKLLIKKINEKFEEIYS